jgi:hypothetical protein
MITFQLNKGFTPLSYASPVQITTMMQAILFPAICPGRDARAIYDLLIDPESGG